jgi:ribosomal protein S18 acetylase RimI-like enzyme
MVFRMADVLVRDPHASEILELARIWHDGYHDAHATLMPEALIRARSLESFYDRVQTHLADVRVAGRVGAPVGFYMLKSDELYQLYVSVTARGTGAAAALIADAEIRLRERGTETAWLSCAIGNGRAARFYEKSGWIFAGTFISRLETPEGPFDVEVQRYEKRLLPITGSP